MRPTIEEKMMLKDNGKSQIKVFVSYCEKVKRHADRVTELAECLKNKGFLVKFDKWEDPGEGWIAWMQKEIPRADFVICVFERHYRTTATVTSAFAAYRLAVISIFTIFSCG